MKTTTWTRNGEPMSYGPFITGEGADAVEHPADALVCWDDAKLATFDIIRTEVDPTAAEICALIDAHRDARIVGGFEYMTHRFQSRATDRENISGLGADASEAIRDGAQPGDYLWHPEFPLGFGFITEANVTVPMDAFQTKGLRMAGVGFKARLTLHARDLKDAVLAAEDPTSINWREGWPE